VLVPTFNDPRDRLALCILAELFPEREVLGIHAVDLVWGLGTLHCLTQQQPSAG
jgi:agmatine deiminase